jgi:hypothetical protein
MDIREKIELLSMEADSEIEALFPGRPGRAILCCARDYAHGKHGTTWSHAWEGTRIGYLAWFLNGSPEQQTKGLMEALKTYSNA